MAVRTSLLKVAMEKQDYPLAAKCLVYGLLKVTCDSLEAEERKRNGRKKDLRESAKPR